MIFTGERRSRRGWQRRPTIFRGCERSYGESAGEAIIQNREVDWQRAFCDGVRMSFAEVLEELAGLTFEQRQEVVRRALELDDAPLSAEEEALVESRLAAHRADPESSIPLEELKRQLRTG